MRLFLAGLHFFPTVMFAQIKICNFACFGEDEKCFKLLFNFEQTYVKKQG